MRILIKGGVWKNTEDEILKAAVMKYGKNQWARVASLLTRKSAKQCKARWYEWLDPSIKKIEWSREEEEKLLHLAKLMPNQWRTIAPIVGRTAGQCMEHYERLLDQAQEGGAEASDDPRRLRPGEIDPAPETKPARPDPIDMDEDEKEMLAEARARLANTKGKKAKRKARERQLEESRRLSTLQKRRELKAAGIETSLGGGKKRKYIDYSREIPFQMVPPAGFYDVGDELTKEKALKLDPMSKGLELSKIEGRHQAVEEENERQKDKKRLKALFKANAQQAIENISSQNDPTTLRRRSELALPAPQVTDGELEEIVRAGQSSLMLPPDISSGSKRSRLGGNSAAIMDATSSLIGDYSAQFKSSMPTPLRTPQQENIILQEARNARALREMTPFSGEEELPELHEGTGFDGITPRSAKLATPNTVLSTPGRGPNNALQLSGSGSAAVLGTPASNFGGSSSEFTAASQRSGAIVRDHLKLNEVSLDSFSSAKAKAKEIRATIANQLKSLPEPEFVYELSIPELEKDDDMDAAEEMVAEDAADIEEKLRLEKEELIRLELERRSSVLKQELPRPAVVKKSYVKLLNAFGANQASNSNERIAIELVNEESVRMLLADEIRYPVANTEAIKIQQRTHPSERLQFDQFINNSNFIDEIENTSEFDDYVQQARASVQLEYQEWLAAGLAIDEGANTSDKIEEFNAAWEELHKKYVFIPTRGADGLGEFGIPADKQETLSSLMAQFSALRARIEKDSKKSIKIENKVSILTKGYASRAEKLDSLIAERFNAYWKAVTDLKCFRQLQQNEQVALSKRLTTIKTEMLQAESNESEWQRKYAALQEQIAMPVTA